LLLGGREPWRVHRRDGCERHRGRAGEGGGLGGGGKADKRADHSRQLCEFHLYLLRISIIGIQPRIASIGRSNHETTGAEQSVKTRFRLAARFSHEVSVGLIPLRPRGRESTLNCGAKHRKETTEEA